MRCACLACLGAYLMACSLVDVIVMIGAFVGVVAMVGMIAIVGGIGVTIFARGVVGVLGVVIHWV